MARGKEASQIKKDAQRVPTIVQIRRGRTFWRVQAARPPPVLRVVVHKHVVGHGQHVAVHVDRGGHDNLWRQAPVRPEADGSRPARRRALNPAAAPGSLLEATCAHTQPFLANGVGGLFCCGSRLLLFQTRYTNYSLISYYAHKWIQFRGKSLICH